MDKLIEKTIPPYDSLDKNRGEGCLINALNLYDKAGGGLIYWVGNIKVDNKDIIISHAYFIPPDAPDDFIALNQADSGYDQYPPFTVKDLKNIGRPENIDELRSIINRTDSGYEF